MTSGTRPRMKAIRRGREGVRDRERPGPSENQATSKRVLDNIIWLQSPEVFMFFK